jgi:hypothetical protein
MNKDSGNPLNLSWEQRYFMGLFFSAILTGYIYQAYENYQRNKRIKEKQGK